MKYFRPSAESAQPFSFKESTQQSCVFLRPPKIDPKSVKTEANRVKSPHRIKLKYQRSHFWPILELTVAEVAVSARFEFVRSAFFLFRVVDFCQRVAVFQRHLLSIVANFRNFFMKLQQDSRIRENMNERNQD